MMMVAEGQTKWRVMRFSNSDNNNKTVRRPSFAEIYGNKLLLGLGYSSVSR